MVVYWAPWCPNWKHDVGFVQELHKKYGKDGLGVIGVAEYDSLEKIKKNYEQNNLTFPSVYESTTYPERLTTAHYAHRTSAGDTRKWGSPWYVFLDPAKLQAGDVLAAKAQVVNGELIKPEVEKFIREKLAGGSVASRSKDVEAGEPDAGKPASTKP